MDNKIKPSFDVKRTCLGTTLPLQAPFNVIIDSSECCNFKCNYCFRADEDKRKWGYAKSNKIMEWDMFCSIIEGIREFDDEVKQISLSCHGEPLCNRRLPDMVRYIKAQGITSRVSIHTNASLLDEAYARDLADSDIDRIVVSLQGLSSKKYAEVCGAKLDFEQFYHNLEILFQNKKHTQIFYKIMDLALEEGEEEKFYHLFEKIGDRVFVEQAVPIWEGVDLKSQAKADSRNKYGEKFQKQSCCPLTFHTIVIAPDGDVYPCTQLLLPKPLGNIKDRTLKEFWNGEERKQLLMNQLELKSAPICKDCYILQNSIYTKEDMIDEYRKEILKRMV